MKSLRLDNRLPNPLFAPVVLAAVILVVYFTSIGSGLHSIDDPGIVARFSSPPPLSEILIPGKSHYFRPVIELTFFVDSKLWSMEPSVMHLENILLHIVNTLLVFYISRKTALRYPESNPFIPLLAALLFALHPLNVEAVSWIAGRTDPLAATFILSACFLWLHWLENLTWQYAAGTAVLFVLGVLTKETALAFLPVSLLILFMWPDVSARKKFIAACWTGALIVSAVILFFLMRENGVVSFGRLFFSNGVDAADLCRITLAAFGFYVKKLFLPLPLNFAITEVSSVYGLLGGMILVLVAGALMVRSFTALFFAASALMIVPALVAASLQITWTPFAERYMYMPAAFLCVGMSCLLSARPPKTIKVMMPASIILIIIAGYVSYQRNVLWKDKRAFFEDAVTKSPQFGSLYNELGGLLLQERQAAKAAEAFSAADRLNKRPSMKMLIKSNIMAAMVAQGSFVAARDYFFGLFGHKKEAPAVFLELLYTADSTRLATIKEPEKDLLALDLLETLELLYLKNPDPFWLYRSGQIALAAGKTNHAANFFRKAYTAAPDDAHYKGAARTNYQKLEGK